MLYYGQILRFFYVSRHLPLTLLLLILMEVKHFNGLAEFLKNGQAISVNGLRTFKNSPDCILGN